MKKNSIFIIVVTLLCSIVVWLYYNAPLRNEIVVQYDGIVEKIKDYYYINTNKIDYLEGNPQIINSDTIGTGMQFDLSTGHSYLISGSSTRDFLTRALQITLSGQTTSEPESVVVSLLACTDTIFTDDACIGVWQGYLKNGITRHLNTGQVENGISSCVVIDPYERITPDFNMCTVVKNTAIIQFGYLRNTPGFWRQENTRRKLLINQKHVNIISPLILTTL